MSVLNISMFLYEDYKGNKTKEKLREEIIDS